MTRHPLKRRLHRIGWATALLLAIAGCSSSDGPDRQDGTDAGNGANRIGPVDTGPATPPAPDYANMSITVPEPGQPGGLPDDRTPLVEGPILPGSAQAAATVVESYFALIEQRRFAEAAALWRGDAPDLAAQFANYARIGANVGAPGRIDAGAGQRYVEVPVQLYGRLKDGTVVNALGKATLHRAGDIDGATDAQKQWRIEAIDAEPKPLPAKSAG